MRLSHAVPLTLLAAAAACGTQQKLDTLAHEDSLRVDSLAGVRKDLLDEMITSTQFVADINKELGKARALANETTRLEAGGETDQMKTQRQQIVSRITRLVARLDSVQTRLASTRAQAQLLSQKDSALVGQVAAYEATVADLQKTAEKQRAEFQTVIDGQKVQIASLSKDVDTLSHVRVALLDTVGQLTTEKNTVYYVVGTKEELIKKGVLVAEGQKRFLVVGSRSIVPARKLDPANFTKINRLADRTITLPTGNFEILSRQDQSLVIPQAVKDGKIAGALTIEQPEQFWEPSRFLIIVKN